MQINNISYYNQQKYYLKNNHQVNFLGAKDITLKYVTQKMPDILPQRILIKAKELATSLTPPTLRELHLNTYKPLLKCKTLSEVKNIFPEFSSVIDSGTLIHGRNKALKNMNEDKIKNLSLEILQKYWGKLEIQDKIAEDLGFTNRSALKFIIQKLQIPSFGKNYPTMLKASDEILNTEIGQKTANYNHLHPDLMYAKNKHAAQGCKTEKYRKAQSERIKAYDKAHPERRQKIGSYLKEVWDNLPHIKEKIKEESKNFTFFKIISKKTFSDEPLKEKEKRMKTIFFKHFWEKYPELKLEYNEMRKLIAEKRKTEQLSFITQNSN